MNEPEVGLQYSTTTLAGLGPEPPKRRIAYMAKGPGRQLPERRKRHLGRAAIVALSCLAFFLVAAVPFKDRYGYRLAEFGRNIIGSENTARVEAWYFSVQDAADRFKYRIVGGAASPFSRDDVVIASAAVQTDGPSKETRPILASALAVSNLALPEIKALHSHLGAGEGAWSTAGLPQSPDGKVIAAKTYINPDPARPYASLGLLLLDKRFIRLHMTGGTDDPGGDLGVHGPGRIPEADQNALLVAWNGGFRGPHGGFGMYADGKQYRPLRTGLASVALARDGTIRMGQWGRDLTWSSDLVAVRQNAVLLVDNCQVSARTAEGNDTWGYVEVNSSEFITWRSAIGLTRNGDLLVAAGNSLSAETLARGLWAAGACWAMQLDINSPYVLVGLFFRQATGGSAPVKFMSSMADNPRRFLTTQPHDFMYVTYDDSRLAQTATVP